MRAGSKSLIWMAVTGAVAACETAPRSPDLTAIYSRVAEASDGALRRPLITVPGTLGSKLVDGPTGTVVWGGGSRGVSADPDDKAEATLIALPLLDKTSPFSAQRDTVRPAGIIDTAEADFLGVKIEREIYGGIRNTLRAGGFRSGPQRDPETTVPVFDPVSVPPTKLAGNKKPAGDAANTFRFDYDWRRDLAVLAAEFHKFVLDRKVLVAAERSRLLGQPVSTDSVSLDLLAHSMGGLIARYYLMHGPAPLGEDGALPPITWEGAQHFQRVVLVAAPNAGSILALDNLINGKNLGPFQPFYQPAVLGSHASTWQLMPRARHRRLLEEGTGEVLDPFDPGLWERNGWGMADPAAAELLSWLLPELTDPAERRARALTHQARMLRRAERFHLSIDRWAPKPVHLEMFQVVGGGFATAADGLVDPATGSFAINGVEEGDGVVLRASVLLDERQGGNYTAGLRTPLRFDTTLFLPDEHVELTKNPVFGDNLLFWLLEQPRTADELKRPEETSLGALTGKPAEPRLSETDPPASGSEK